jgi:hypothetical protein
MEVNAMKNSMYKAMIIMFLLCFAGSVSPQTRVALALEGESLNSDSPPSNPNALKDSTPSESSKELKDTTPSESSKALKDTTPSESSKALKDTTPSESSKALKDTTPSESLNDDGSK